MARHNLAVSTPRAAGVEAILSSPNPSDSGVGGHRARRRRDARSTPAVYVAEAGAPAAQNQVGAAASLLVLADR